MAKERFVRAHGPLGDDDIVVERGGELDAVVLRDDAARYHAIYDTFGTFVSAARDVTVDELAQEPPLSFEVLALVGVGVPLRPQPCPGR